MKKLGKLNLHNLAQSEMAKREQNVIRGGCGCAGVCYCRYAGEQEGDGDSHYGGTSKDDNGNSNTQPNVYENHQ